MSLSILSSIAPSESSFTGTATQVRSRVGRLPLPARVASMTESDEPALRTVNAFVDAIADLPVSDWIETGRAVLANTQSLATRSTAWTALDATITARQLGVAAWYARDGVETAAAIARGGAPRRLSRSDRQAFYAAQGAAEETALALLAREHLSYEHFDVLAAPYRAIAANASVANARR